MLRTFTRKSRLAACSAAITALSAAAALAQNSTNPANPQISSNNTGSAPQNFNPPTQLPPFSGFNAAAQATADQTLGMSFANSQGLTISAFSDNSPLTNLGLQVGDQIFAFNGQALGGNPNTLMNRLITASRSGQPASMTVYRNGEQVTVNVPTTALQSVAQARAQLGNTRATAGNQIGQNTSAQAVQSASTGGTGAASTGSAIGSGAGTLNLGTSGTGTSGTTAGNDISAAVNAVAGFQNSGGVAVTNQTQSNQGQGALNSVAQSLGLTFANTPGNSLTITSISPSSPFAGLLQVGDQLTSLDGRPLNNPMNLFNQLSLAARGDQSATLSIMRNGSPQTVSLSNSLLDRIAQTQPLLTPDVDRLASRPNATQNNPQSSTQNSAQSTESSQNAVQQSLEERNAETGLLTPGAVTGSGSATAGQNSNLPTTVITPNGPRITIPGQNQGRGRSGAVAPGGGTGIRPMPHTGPGGKAPSSGARPAGGGAAASGGGAAAGGS